MIIRLFFTLLVLVPISGTARASTLCVTNGVQLKAALLLAKVNGQADIIRMATGVYVHPDAEAFNYGPLNTEPFDLELSGGWTATSAGPCGQLPDSSRAVDTIVTTDHTHSLMNMFLSDVTAIGMDVRVRRLTFLGGDGLTGSIGGLTIIQSSSNTGTVQVDQCAFIGNSGGFAAALFLSTQVGNIRLSNSLFLDNEATSTTAAFLLDGQGGSGGIYVTNNTFLGNTNTSTSGRPAALAINALFLTQALVANNNFWGNRNGDLYLIGGGNKILRHNNLQGISGTVDESTNNISVTPVFASGYLNFTPADGSPLIDAGIRPNSIVPIPVPFDQAWGTGALDVFSRPRTQGARIDIGAYESSFDTRDDTLFASGFD